MIFLAKGNCRLGLTKRDKEGNVVETIPARFETDPEGGSIAVGVLDDDTMEPVGTTEIYGDFDPWGYLSRTLELLAPKRAGNIPDLENIFKKMYEDYGSDKCPVLDWCERGDCRDCIIQRWMEEADEK